VKITKDQTVREVKAAFSKYFTGLKIEFYSKKHEPAQASSNAYIIADEKKLMELSTVHVPIDIPINGSMMVSELETLFEMKGLHAQVFRKSNDVWIQTTATDSYTLNKQQELSN